MAKKKKKKEDEEEVVVKSRLNLNKTRAWDGKRMLSSSGSQASGPVGFRKEPSFLLPDLLRMRPPLPCFAPLGSFLHGLSMSGCQVLSWEQRRTSPSNKTAWWAFKLLTGRT